MIQAQNRFSLHTQISSVAILHHFLAPDQYNLGQLRFRIVCSNSRSFIYSFLPLVTQRLRSFCAYIRDNYPAKKCELRHIFPAVVEKRHAVFRFGELYHRSKLNIAVTDIIAVNISMLCKISDEWFHRPVSKIRPGKTIYRKLIRW